VLLHHERRRGLLCIGAVMVLSAQSVGAQVEPEQPIAPERGTLKQMAYAAVAMVTMVAVSCIDYRWFGRPWWLGVRPVTWLLLVSTVMVALTFAPGVA